MHLNKSVYEVPIGKHSSGEFLVRLRGSDKRLLHPSFPSFLRFFACVSAAPTDWHSVKFDIRKFYKNLSRNSKYGYNIEKNI
jgi:hypothetical protein